MALSGLRQLVRPLMELVSTFKALVRVLVRDCHFIICNNARYSTGLVGGFGRSNVRNVKFIKLQSLTWVGGWMGGLERYHGEVIFLPAVSTLLAVPCALYHAHGTVRGTRIGPTHSVFFHARPDAGPARFRAHGTVNSEQGYMNM